MNEQALSILQRLPLIPILVAYVAYLGWNYYTFTTDPTSPLLQKNVAIEVLQKEVDQGKEKVRKAEEFYRTLEQHRTELRGLAQQLDEAKASLNEQLDIPSFMRMVNTEATKVGMTVLGLKPTESHEHEYYV